VGELALKIYGMLIRNFEKNLKEACFVAFLTPKRYEEQPCPSSESAGSRIISNGNFEGFIYGEQVKFLGIKAKRRGHPRLSLPTTEFENFPPKYIIEICQRLCRLM